MTGESAATMAAVSEILDQEKTFLAPFMPPVNARPDRPFVTLTYASSLDGMIAIARGARTTLSGAETKSMTHYLRLKHDAILVGSGTAIADDPSLNCRYPGATFDDQPAPYIISTHQRWNHADSKVVKLFRAHHGKAPRMIRHTHSKPSSSPSGIEATTGGPNASDSNRISWDGILSDMKKNDGINSVMIEGGAEVIKTLLTRPDLIDSVIITVAPTWLGNDGVAAVPLAKVVDGQPTNAAHLDETAWRQFGNDMVLCGRLRR